MPYRPMTRDRRTGGLIQAWPQLEMELTQVIDVSSVMHVVAGLEAVQRITVHSCFISVSGCWCRTGVLYAMSHGGGYSSVRPVRPSSTKTVFGQKETRCKWRRGRRRRWWRVGWGQVAPLLRLLRCEFFKGLGIEHDTWERFLSFVRGLPFAPSGLISYLFLWPCFTLYPCR